MTVSAYTRQYLDEVGAVARGLDGAAIDRIVEALVRIRADGGRLFVLGVGGGAGNAGHAVNDFRKIVGLEAYAPTDNAAELTARINDDGWETVFAHWLDVSRIGPKDAVLVFSVGGGSLERNVSVNIVRAVELAKARRATILGIVGRDGGHTARLADACVIVPTVNPDTVTPHTEAFQAVVWHLIVSHPRLKRHDMKWEGLGR